MESLQNLASRLQKSNLVVAVDCETVGVNPKTQSTGTHGQIYCWSLAFRTDVVHGYWLPGPAMLPKFGRVVLETLRPWLASDAPKVGHNWFGFDANVFRRAGTPVNGIICDTLLFSKVLPGPDKARHGLKELASTLLGYSFGKFDDLFSERIPMDKPLVISSEKRTRRKIDGTFVHTLLWPGEYPRPSKKRRHTPLDVWVDRYPDKLDVLQDYATYDAVFTLELFEFLSRRGREEKSHKNTTFNEVYKQYFRGYGECLAEIAYRGVAFDSAVNSAAADALASEVNPLRDELAVVVGGNPASSKQLAKFLYETLQLPIPKFCGSGQATKLNRDNKQVTDEIALRTLAEQSGPSVAGILNDILKYKKQTKLLQFLVALPTFVVDGRIHARLSPDTDTGRLSCKSPNLQQIPKSVMRKAFVAAPGKLLVIADFSQMEMVILAHICVALFGEHTLATALKAEDFHARTAQLCWPTKYAENPKLYRKYAKSINYGINYGKGPAGLGVQLGVSTDEAKAILEQYYGAFPEVLQYKEYMQNCASRNGWVPMLDGRRRLLPHAQLKSSYDDYLRALRSKALRQALNTPIQGSAAAIVNVSMGLVQLSKELRQLEAYPVLQIHDELILEVPERNASVAKDILVRIMETAVPLQVPLHVDARCAATWYEEK